MKIYTQEELYSKTVSELRELCQRYGITGMSKRRKDEIVDAIEEYYDDKAGPVESNDDNDYTSDPYSNDELNSATPDVSQSGIVSMNAQLSSYRNPDTTNADDKYITNVSVSCGAASGNFPVVGKTVGAVSEFLREVLNIDRLSVGVVNGEEADDNYILLSNDSLEFLKAGGRKG